MSDNHFDVLVVGAGGAGMMCAMQAALRGRRVALVDHASKIGRKILISGGGRCNFTNMHATPENYYSNNMHFAKSALARYTPDDFINMVRKHRIAYHEKKLGQLFCDGSAEQIVNMLVRECEQAGVQFITGCRIDRVVKSDTFNLSTTAGMLSSQSLVIATGGLSIPKIGATGFGYDLARQFGLALVEPAPALVGLNFSRSDLNAYAEISGVSVDTTVACNRASFRENILFTHTGLSGPAILQASLYWNPGSKLDIDLLPALDAASWLKRKQKESPNAELRNILAEQLPRRFAERYALQRKLAGSLKQMTDKEIADLAGQLKSWSVAPSGSVGYSKAEVTRGGVDTNELSSRTMEAKKVPGLYFIGEVVDVTGWLGGYNFQWAWASGFAAGQSA